MADNSGSNTLLGLLVGGLIVFLVLAFAIGWWPNQTRTTEVNVNLPKVEAPKLPSPAPSK
jgi:type II secretory pathway component PulM